jgi:hypothetical protein
LETILAGERYGFLFTHEFDNRADFIYVALFTDDADVPLQLDQDMRLIRK